MCNIICQILNTFETNLWRTGSLCGFINYHATKGLGLVVPYGLVSRADASGRLVSSSHSLGGATELHVVLFSFTRAR